MNTDFKGTKGGWRYEFNGFYYDIKPMQEGISHQAIAAINDNEYIGGSGEQTQANALLMSKAPELLEMVSELLKELSFHGHRNSTTIYEANALIKSATELPQ